MIAVFLLFRASQFSNSAARYKDNFTVEESDVHALFNKVMAFVSVAKEMCNQKIAVLDQQAETYRELKKKVKCAMIEENTPSFLSLPFRRLVFKTVQLILISKGGMAGKHLY